MPEPAILINEDSLEIITAEATDLIPLKEICALIAYKRDELTTDLVCCDIVTRHGDSQLVRTVHEDMPGFEALMTHFQALPGFDLKWREAVTLPPFAGNRTPIYYRAHVGKD